MSCVQSLHHLSASLGDSAALYWAVAGALVVITAFSRALLYTRTPPAQPPTRFIHRLKNSLPLIGDTWEMLANAPRFHDWVYEICAPLHGDPVRISALGRPDLVVVSTVEAFEDCFNTQFERFPKGPVQCENLAGMLGHGIFASDDGRWNHQRKTATNLFTARAVREGMAASVRHHTETLCRVLGEHARADSPVDLFRLFNQFTLETFAEIGFGVDMKLLEGDGEHAFQSAFDSVQRAIIYRFVRPSWFWKLQRLGGVGAEGMLQREMKVIDDTVLGIIRHSLERRQRGDGKTCDGTLRDIVSLFLDNYESSRDHGATDRAAAFDPMYLRDIVVNFLIAGRDTTAQALSWFFYCISKEPHVVQTIRDEIEHNLPRLVDATMATPSMEQVSQLTYLEAALKETLRLYPSVPFNTKHASSDAVLSDGTFIRKGTDIAVPSYTLGRMTHVWGEDARAFKPERFIDSTTGRLLPFAPSKFIAFNAGPRLCLGKSLAMMEMKIVAATVLARYDVALLQGQRVTYDFSLTLPVHGELLARVVAHTRRG